MKNYNYNKLKGRIKEICGTQGTYAKLVGLSDTSINNKLNNKVQFTQDEIYNSLTILNISPNEIVHIFFTKEVEDNSTKKKEGE